MQTGKVFPPYLRKPSLKKKNATTLGKDPFLLFPGGKKMQKNPFLMLSTGIPAGMVNHTRRDGCSKDLPEVVSMYNKHMGGVDKVMEFNKCTLKQLTICSLSADQLILYYGLAHRSIKW